MPDTKNKKRGTLVWTTGISGCGRKEYLERFRKNCEKRGKKILIYHVGQMLFDYAKKNNVSITPAKVLNAPRTQLDTLRSGVFEMILGGPDRVHLEKDLAENDVVVINVHTVFYWKEGYINAYNPAYLKEFDPDIFICFIDAGEDILERLHSRKQWQAQNMGEKDALLWQNVEVNNTLLYPDWLGGNKKCFVIPVKQPSSTLYNIIFESWRPVVYAQMPITHLLDDKKEFKKVKKFIEKLEKYFIVFSPLTIETGKVDNACAKEALTRHYQTVIRDNEWFIGQSDICIAYIFKVVFTAGVIDEIREAYDTNKETWVIFPESHSPFLRYRAMNIFQTQEELFEFVEKEYWPQIQKGGQK